MRKGGPPARIYSIGIYSPKTIFDYDGDGRRVDKGVSSLVCDVSCRWQRGYYKVYWYDIAGNVLEETDGAGNLSDDYIYFGGKRIARIDSSGNVAYYVADHLGSARVVTNATGTIQDDSDFYPFGGERPILSSSGNTYKFTGKERDSESSLDNFGARYYSSQYGRFMSIDPIGIMKQKVADPQQWNMYSYTRNNPLRFRDPLGMYSCTDDNNSCRTSQDNAFADALIQARNSTDSWAILAATAYGSRGIDNGVSIGFETMAAGDIGTVVFNMTSGKANGTLQVTFNKDTFTRSITDIAPGGREGADNVRLFAVVHEAAHVQDDMNLIKHHYALKYDITRRVSEEHAYGLEENLLERKFNQANPNWASASAIDHYLKSINYPEPDALILSPQHIP